MADKYSDYRGDVTYEVWRSGGNVDRIDDDRIEDRYHDGTPYESAAREELEHQRPPHPPTATGWF